MQSPPSPTPHLAQEPAGGSDAQIADAMDRVLDAEHAAQAAIAACTLEAEATLTRARQAARLILDRAHERIIALHAKAALALKQQPLSVRKDAQPAARVDAQQRNRAAFEAAIAKLADSLLDARLEKS